jgi:hypothetical protein
MIGHFLNMVVWVMSAPNGYYYDTFSWQYTFKVVTSDYDKHEGHNENQDPHARVRLTLTSFQPHPTFQMFSKYSTAFGRHRRMTFISFGSQVSQIHFNNLKETFQRRFCYVLGVLYEYITLSRVFYSIKTFSWTFSKRLSQYLYQLIDAIMSCQLYKGWVCKASLLFNLNCTVQYSPRSKSLAKFREPK